MTFINLNQHQAGAEEGDKWNLLPDTVDDWEEKKRLSNYTNYMGGGLVVQISVKP